MYLDETRTTVSHILLKILFNISVQEGTIARTINIGPANNTKKITYSTQKAKSRGKKTRPNSISKQFEMTPRPTSNEEFFIIRYVQLKKTLISS